MCVDNGMMFVCKYGCWEVVGEVDVGKMFRNYNGIVWWYMILILDLFLCKVVYDDNDVVLLKVGVVFFYSFWL